MTAHDDRRAAYEERAARLYPDNDTTYGPYAVQEAYVDGALYSNPGVPRVISTREELAALDPDTVLLDVDDPWHEVRMSASEWMEDYTIDAEGIFPLAIIATGEHVRAARQALEEA